MPPERKSAYFQPTVPLPPQTILSLETELSYFRHRRPLLLETELRPFSLRNQPHPYRFPIPRRGGTPDRDCLDWPQYPLTLPVSTAVRRSTETTSVPLRSRSHQPTPAPGPSRQSPAPAHQGTPAPAPARQPTPGPSTIELPEVLNTSTARRPKSVRFPSADPDPDDDDDDDDDDERANEINATGKVATPDDDGLISKPDGEVGRRKRGYSLAVVLGWTPSKLKSAKDLVHSYVENYLNHSLSCSKQPSGHVDSLTKLIQAHNPRLVDRYRDGWPIRDVIYLRLKYTSSRFKSGQVVGQGKNYPQDPKKALKEIREQGKGKQRAGVAS